MNKEELEEYFKSDKSDFYDKFADGTIVWDKEKVYDFWDKIWKYKIEVLAFNFEEFIFPPFQHKYYSLYEEERSLHSFKDLIEYNHHLSFSRCVFLGKSDFSGIIFKKPVDFSGAIFKSSTSFYNCKFHFSAKFNNTIFSKSTSFNSCFMKDMLYFNNSSFQKDVDLKNVISLRHSNFSGTVFNDNVAFDNSFFHDLVLASCQFHKEMSFKNVKLFKKYNNFRNTIFSETHRSVFQNLICYEDYSSKIILDLINVEGDKVKPQIGTFNLDQLALQKDENYEIPSKNLHAFCNKKIHEIFNKSSAPNLFFKKAVFTNKVAFRDIHLKNVKFSESNFWVINFELCDWSFKNSPERLYLKDEEQSSYIQLETMYRVLKIKYSKKQNWELCGLAYISEMEMRKKRLWNEKRYFHWFIYWFYGFFGGYTQDYLRPFISLVFLIILSSLVYFFIDFNLVRAFQRGVKGALPYISINFEDPFKDNWLIVRNIEFLLSTIFLTFFILALRKRFKQ